MIKKSFFLLGSQRKQDFIHSMYIFNSLYISNNVLDVIEIESNKTKINKK